MPDEVPSERCAARRRVARLPRAAAIGGMALALVSTACGRGGSRRATELSFEQLSDTAGLSRGRPLLTAFEAERLTGGAMRVRGRLDFPDGTRLQIRVVRARTGEVAQVMQTTIADGAFETPPFMSERGPLPEDRWRFELLAHFNDVWQSAEVLRATGDGQRLRGPGITRTSMGTPTFSLREERRL